MPVKNTQAPHHKLSVDDNIAAEHRRQATHDEYKHYQSLSPVGRYAFRLKTKRPFTIALTFVPLLAVFIVLPVSAAITNSKSSSGAGFAIQNLFKGADLEAPKSPSESKQDTGDQPNVPATEQAPPQETPQNPGINNTPSESQDDSPSNNDNTQRDIQDADSPRLPDQEETPGTPAPSNPAPTNPTIPVRSSFGIASWNTLYDNSPSNVGNGVKELTTKGGDIVTLQELHRPDRRTNIRDKIVSCKGCSYAGYVRDYTTSASTPASLAIFWNKNKFSSTSMGYVKVSDPQGKDPNYISAKWITWARLREKQTNREFYVLNTHTVAGVESGGKRTGVAIRLNAHKAHMDKLDQTIDNFQKTGLPIFITGDFNVNYRKDKDVRDKNFPYYRMNQQGVRSGWQLFGMPSGGTHGDGTRLIDYVMSMNHGAITPQSNSIYGKRLGSDHSPVIMKIQIQK